MKTMSEQQQLNERIAELEACANGTPYFLVLQRGDNVSSRLMPGFDVGLIFQALTRIMEQMPQYKSEYADNIIELTKVLKS